MKTSDDLLANVHSIETFGAFDGPGLRYIVFMQGCPFKCQYCHNRDTWTTKENKLMSVDDIINNYKRYQKFYQKGGITVSGGEPLLQINFLIKLFKRCKEENIHTAIDTSAASYDINSNALFDELMQYTDLVLLDIKQINEKKHKELVGYSNKRVLEFAEYLNNINKDVQIRHVVIPTLTLNEEDLKALRRFLDTLNNVVGIDVLPYHTKGKTKWEQLGLEYPIPHIKEPTKEEIKYAENILKTDYKFKK